MLYISPASEFPNDNPALHDGAIWVCEAPCAIATAELPGERAPVDARGGVDEGASVDERVSVSVDERESLDVDAADALAVVEAPVESGPALELAIDETVVASHVEPHDEDEGEIEIVDDLDAVDEGDDAATEEIAATSGGAVDPFSFYVQTLTDVMIAAGGRDAAAHLVAALSQEPTACAWRRIISGESEDYTACGPKSLDEWSAELVARLISMPAKTDQLRRELRSRGVAAFGLVVD